MRILLSWLREFCPTDLSAEEVADALTRQGVEVESLVRPWERLSGVVVGRVLDVRDHPNADKLCVADVDDGGGERTVVVGVRNMRPGDLVPYAVPGATLPGFEGVLEARELRGEVSEGMLCSPKELGISPDHTAILVLEEGEPGRDVVDLLGLDDAVLDVEIFPNRPDLMSVVGVAREMAAATGADLRLPDTSVAEGEGKAAEAATVEVLDAERCPRYLARVVTGVRVGPSPISAQIRLTASGMRPLSNVVDATNYALIEMGHPMHPFDLAALEGPSIVVRRARDGERLITLDEVERAFTEDDLLIADAERGVAVAGVMGGAETEVGEGTTDVLLESAYFQPLGVLRTARRLGLKTEASVRFERGADPEAVAPAAARAAGLITAWSGGTVLPGEIDAGGLPSRRTLRVRSSRASLLLGMSVTTGDVLEVMERLRLPAAGDGDAVQVEVPGHRVDLGIEADLIEEVGRVLGYENIPSSLPGVKQAGGLSTEQRLGRRVRDALVRAGLHEAQSSSFARAADLKLFEDARARGVRVANPIAEDEGFLRTSLLPGLLRAAALSTGHRRPAVRLFEVGHVMHAGDDGPVEREQVAVLLAGPAAEQWPAERRERDFLDAKGVLERLMEALGAAEEWALGDPLGSPYHPGRSATVLLEGEAIGELGEIHPRVTEAFDLEARVAAFEVQAEPLLAAAGAEVAYAAVSRFPPIRRDVAFLLDADTPAGAVKAALAEAAGELLDRVLLFDVFEGEPLPAGKKSLAFAVDFRAPDRTLTDEEANELVRGIAERLATDFGAELRAG